MAEQGRKPEFIIMDNLSSLRRGAEENDNSALDEILPWLVALRHKGYATLLVHHAGKMGDQRGASRLEDPLDTTIKLTPSKEANGDGAAVNMEFTKTRNIKPNPAYLTMNLVEGEDGILEWDYGETTKFMPQDHTLRIVYKGPAGDGSKRFAKQKELVDAVGLKAPAISKHLSALCHDELVDKKGLTVTEKGKDAFVTYSPTRTSNKVALARWRILARQKLSDFSKYICRETWKLFVGRQKWMKGRKLSRWISRNSKDGCRSS
ncbi:AAA family ATPase [Stappia sp. ICDLI1TA098]